MPGRCWSGRDRRAHALRLDSGDDRVDQLVAHRLFVRLGQDVGGRSAGLGGSNPLDDRRRVLVARVEPLEVDEGDPAEPAEARREVGIRDGVHGRGQERDLEPEAAEIGGKSTSAGSAVTAPGTSATSSKPYARRRRDSVASRTGACSIIARPPDTKGPRGKAARAVVGAEAVTARIGFTACRGAALAKYTGPGPGGGGAPSAVSGGRVTAVWAVTTIRAAKSSGI